MIITPEDCVRKARTWLGVPFLHQGRSRESGVDCLGLLVMVADDLGLRFGEQSPGETHTLNYTKLPDTQALAAGLAHFLSRVDDGVMRVSDVVLMCLEGRAQHVGLLSDYAHGGLGLIHAYAPARAVVEHRLDAHWQKKICAIFRFIS
jgi:cell wall-associated NlpC family hydrolase